MMSEIIEKNIARAFSEESKASDRTAAFVLKAEQEGYSELARLFRAVADAKSIHARRFRYIMRGKIGTTEENMKDALQNEIAAVDNDYPKMVEDAKDGSLAVRKAFAQSMKTNREFAVLYENALKDMPTSNDTVYYVCQICGHIHLNAVPKNCPVCMAVPGRFKKVL